MFERFYRADAPRGMPGSGLGLAIVRQAAEAHGGFVRAANAEGGGALMTLGFGQGSAPAPAGPGPASAGSYVVLRPPSDM